MSDHLNYARDGNFKPEMNLLFIFIFWVFALSVKKQMREFNLPSNLKVQIFLTKDMMKRIAVFTLLYSLSDLLLFSTCSSRFSFIYHNCILTSSSQLKCWGWGGTGQLGYGDTSNRGIM